MALLKGDTPDIMSSNAQELQKQGLNELDAHTLALKTARKTRPDTSKNLGGFLHKPKKA